MIRSRILFVSLFIMTVLSGGCISQTSTLQQPRSITVEETNPVNEGQVVHVILTGFPADQWATVNFGTNDQYTITDTYIDGAGNGATWHTYPCGFNGQITAWPKNQLVGKGTAGPVIQTKPCPQGIK